MAHRRPALLAALVLTAAAAVAAIVPTAAGAVDQDLVVSAVAGPPGTVITLSSASCVSGGEFEAYLDAQLIVGTAPDQQLAAVGSNIDGSAKLTVPDWVDPAGPAVIEATCSVYDVEGGTEETVDFDPVAFDLEPGSGSPTQVRTFSRTELLAGQGFTVTGSCGAAAADNLVSAILVDGTDQSGRTVQFPIAQEFADTDASGGFDIPVIVSNATVWIGSAGVDSTIESLGTSEEPLQIEPGDYTIFVACHIPMTPSSLILEPATITVTGSAPTGRIDLTAEPAGTRGVVMTGDCGEPVAGELYGLSLADLIADFEGSDGDAARTGRVAALLADAPSGDAVEVRAGDRRDGAESRLVASEGIMAFTATPDAAGTWRHDDAADFDQGIVLGRGTCGDPFGDGFAYDPQGVVVDALDVPDTTTTTTTTVTTVPIAAPANAVSGTPDYAG